MDEVWDILVDFARLFRRGPSLPQGLVAMPLVVALVWPLANIASGDPRAAFMLTFVLVLALRFALTAERSIRKLAAVVAPRTTAIVLLMAGPGVIAALIWAAEPIWCQRLLSLYFAAMTLAYMADVLSGKAGVLTFHFARNWHDIPAALLGRMMVIYSFAMLLANETLIQHAGFGAWLIFFAFLPQITQRMALALIRTAHPQGAI